MALKGYSAHGTAQRHGPGRHTTDRYELHIRSGFAAAHRLREYDGNCERLHGHNWQIDVVLTAQALGPLGMAIDFRDAKRLVAQVLDRFDHRYLNDLEPFRDENPTTEHIARTLYEALTEKVPDGIAVAKVTAWESPDCGASFSRTP